MKKLLTLLGTVMTMLFVISCGSSKQEPTMEKKSEARKVAIVYSTGGKGDKSFNDSAYRGLQMAKEQLGISFSEYEPKDPSAEAQNQLSNYAEKGEYDLIIAVGFSMKDSLVAVAKEFPDQKFALIDEVIDDMPNVVSLMFKEQEGSFLAGAISAMMSKSKVIGFVGAIEVPVIQRFQTGFIQGARYIDPSVKVLSVFINGSNPFNDPVSSKALTETLVAKGVDIVHHAAGASGAGVFKAAKEKGIFAIGVDSNQDDVIPGTILTSVVKNVDVSVLTTIKDVLDGKFKSGVKNYGIKENGLSLTDFKNTKQFVKPEYLSKIEQIEKDIREGKIVVKEEVVK